MKKLIKIFRIIIKIGISLFVAIKVVELLNYLFVWEALFWEAFVTVFLFVAVLGALSDERW